MLKFNEETTLNIIESFDEENDEISSQSTETFSKDEIIDADIYEYNENTINIQFGDGSVAIGVDKNIIEEI